MWILGVSCFYHDGAAALLRNGEIVAAAQEERFSRKKHDSRFPVRALRFCLDEGGIEPDRLDLVVFYEKPFLKFERILETYLTFAPRGFPSFIRAIPLWMKQKLWMKGQILAAVLFWKHRPVWPYLASFGGLLILLAGVAPVLLGPGERAWMSGARALGWVMIRVILGVVFVVLFTPAGLIIRLLRRDPLSMRFKRDRSTYWIEREPTGPSPDRLERMF